MTAQRAALALLAGLGMSPASAACKIDPIMFDFQIHTSTNMQLGAGEYCAGNFQFPTVKIKEVVVQNQPQRGLVSVDQKSLTWRYRPFKDFRGNDRFIVRVHGTKGKLTSDGTIVFNVVVR